MRRLAVVALVAALTSACAPGTDLGTLGQRSVDVDTPALRAQRAAAHIAPCADPTTTKHDLGRAGLPDLTLPCLGGGDSVDLARLRGPLVITFWASWCGPCRRELPIFQRFAKKYAGRVSVLGIDYLDTHPDAALQLAQRSGVRFPLLADTETAVTLKGHLPVTLLPTLAFVDAEGRLATWGDTTPPARVKATEIQSLAELEKLAVEHLGADALAAPATPTTHAKKKSRR